MDAAWPISSGEALHTSTFLGHPVGCAMALAQIETIREQQLVGRSERLGKFLLRELAARIGQSQLEFTVRGMGLMAGVEISLAGGVPATIVALRVVKDMLQRGFIVLPEGAHANVISFTPPLTISERQLAAAVKALHGSLGLGSAPRKATRR